MRRGQRSAEAEFSSARSAASPGKATHSNEATHRVQTRIFPLLSRSRLECVWGCCVSVNSSSLSHHNKARKGRSLSVSTTTTHPFDIKWLATVGLDSPALLKKGFHHTPLSSASSPHPRTPHHSSRVSYLYLHCDLVSLASPLSHPRVPCHRHVSPAASLSPATAPPAVPRLAS